MRDTGCLLMQFMFEEHVHDSSVTEHLPIGGESPVRFRVAALSLECTVRK